MIKYKYFVKTEQELITEFGSNWRNIDCLGVSFNSMMDYLLGTEINLQEHPMFLVNGRLVIPDGKWISVSDPNHSWGWALTNNTIKEVFFIPTYNNKRELVYD